MTGNSHAHDMERVSMEDWTKQADIEADQRCPDRCMGYQCSWPATEAFQYIFEEPSSVFRGTVSVATPWQYYCKRCAELMTSFDDLGSIDRVYMQQKMAAYETELFEDED